jgi:diketogulonate reductase-like aldo/keto reductase
VSREYLNSPNVPVYGNEDSVGVAIRESGLKREELYITTKYDGGNIRLAIQYSLKQVCKQNRRPLSSFF